MTDNLQYFDDFFLQGARQIHDSIGYDDESRVVEISDSVTITGMDDGNQHNARVLSATRGSICPSKYFTEDSCSCERQVIASTGGYAPDATSASVPVSVANSNTVPTYVHNSPTGVEGEEEDIKHTLPYDECQNFMSCEIACENEREVLHDRTMETVNYSDDDSLWSLEVDVEKIFRMSRQGCVGLESREVSQATMPPTDSVSLYAPSIRTETKMRKEALKIAQLLCVKSSSESNKKRSNSICNDGDMTVYNTSVQQQVNSKIRNLRDTIEEELIKQGERSRPVRMKRKEHREKINSEHQTRPQQTEQTGKITRLKSERNLNASLKIENIDAKAFYSTKGRPQQDIQIESVPVKPKIQRGTLEAPRTRTENRNETEKLKLITTTAVLTTRRTRSQPIRATFEKKILKPRGKSCFPNSKSVSKASKSISENKAPEKRQAAMKEKPKEVQKLLNQRISRETSRLKSPPKKITKQKPVAKPQATKPRPYGDTQDRPVARPKPTKKSRHCLSRDKEKRTNSEKTKVSERGKLKPSSKASLNASKQANVKKLHLIEKQKAYTATLRKTLKQNTKPNVSKNMPKSSVHGNRREATKKAAEVNHKIARNSSSPQKLAANLKKSQIQAIPFRSNASVLASGDGVNVKPRVAPISSGRKSIQFTVPLQRKTSLVKVLKDPKPASPPKKPPVPVFRTKEKTSERLVKRPEIKAAKPVALKPWLPGKTPRRSARTPSGSTVKKPMPSARPKSTEEVLKQKLRQTTPKPVDKPIKSKSRSDTRVGLSPSKPPSVLRGRLSMRARRNVAVRERGDYSVSSDEYVVTPMFVTPFTLKECYEIIHKQPRHSFTREALTSEIVSLYKGQRTRLGCDLVHCIAAHVQDPSESCPRIPDSKCIDKFQSFFYPLLFKLFRKTYSKIEEIFRQPELKTAVNAESHAGQTPMQLMPLRWATLPSNYLQKFRFLNNYVVSIDLEVRRNVDGYRIGEAMRLEERHDVQIRLTKALFDFDNRGVTSCLESSQVSDLRKNFKKYFRFNRVGSDAVVNTPTPLGQSVFLSLAEELETSSHVAAWINVDDHLQLTTLNESFDRINIVLNTLNSCSAVVVENLNARLNKMRKITCEIRGDFAPQAMSTFMTHPVFGYVTNHPKHLGTGCQLRFLVRMPLIGHLPNIDDVTSDFVDLKAVPFDSEHPDQEVFYVFSECCFNTSEAAMITTTSERMAALLRVEKSMKKCNPRFPEEVTMPVEPLRYLYRKMNSAIFERPQGFQSLTWRCLNSGTVEQNLSLFTSYGGSLAHCIRHNAYHPDETLPRACDPEAYTLFSEFFNRVLSEANRGETGAACCLPEEELGEEDVAALQCEHPRILSFQVRFVRNVAGFAFSPIISATARRLVEMKLLSRLNSLKQNNLGSYYNLKELTTDCEATLDALRKETKGDFHQDVFIINTDSAADKCVGCFRDWPTSRGVYFLTQRPQDTDTAIWINTTDHFKLVAVAKQLSHAYAICQQILHHLHRTSPDLFARSDKSGYLTFCPDEVGNGMRLTARVRLPYLSKKMELFKQLCEKQQLEIQFYAADTQRQTFDIHHTARIGKSGIQSAKLFLHNLKELLQLDHSFEMLETI